MVTDNPHAVGLGRDDWLKAAGGVLFFVAGLLVWWELTSGAGVVVTTNAFDFNVTGIVPYVIFVGIAILTIIVRTGSLRLPGVFVHPELTLVAAVLGTVLVAIRFFVDGWNSAALTDSDVNIERGIGLYLSAVAALLVLAGCILSYLEYRAADIDDDDDEAEDEITGEIECVRPPSTPPSAPPLP